MRVKELSKVTRSTLGPSPLGDKTGSASTGHGFQRHMSDVNTAEYETYLKDLTEKIHNQGEKLGKKADLAEYQKYREMITELFNEAASNSYVFVRTDKFDSRGRHKVFAVIRKVNGRLDELAAAILSDEQDNLQMLGIVDDIRGMLVDLFL